MAILTTNEMKYFYRNKYRTVYAVNGVSYEFEQGRFYAIVGASGCGKTTFLSVLQNRRDLPGMGGAGRTGSADRGQRRI